MRQVLLGVSVLGLLASSCSSTKAQDAGGVMVEISTDGKIEVARIIVKVATNDASDRTLLSGDYWIPNEYQLPGTVSIVSNGVAGASAVLTLIAYNSSGIAVDRRDAVVMQIPNDRVAAFSIVLSINCSGQVNPDGTSKCSTGTTCDQTTGDCAASLVNGSTLPTYGEGGTGGESGTGGTGGGGGTSGVGGSGGAVCTDACTDGQTQCSSGGLASCAKQSDGCWAYGIPAACGAHQACTESLGVSACACSSSLCEQSGTSCQDSQTLATCNVDSNACLYVEATESCESPKSCAGMSPNAACSLTCTDSCQQGQGSCINGQVAFCTLGSNGCLAYGVPVACQYVCLNGACAGSCVPGSKDCIGLTPRTCDASGAWQSAAACQSQLCESGVCGVCLPGAKQCNGNLLQTCQSSGQWDLGMSCPSESPVCNGSQCLPTSTGGPSCGGVASTCGSAGNGNCCASSLVPAGSYDRSDKEDAPASISDFRLDTYELTVGRFRKFVSAYSQTMTPSGAGKNPNNDSDTGWNTAWNTQMSANAAELTGISGVQCSGAYQTWTSSVGANENRPINCVNWYEAYALCIWDGGRLPTEAEWNYAAAAGSEQRKYPWGPADPEANANLAIYGCYYNGTGTCVGVMNLAPVGLVTAGNGKWGQLDLAGNVSEWVQDWYNSSYSKHCDDCANTKSGAERVVRGGDFRVNDTFLRTASRAFDPANSRNERKGFRCVRTP